MNRATKCILILTSIILLGTPFLVFYIKFRNSTLSNKIEDWGHLGEYLNGTLMPLIALAGILITLLLGAIAEKRNQTNILLEQQKQRPLMHVGYFDGENSIELFMENKGMGPLLINNYYLVNRESGEIKDGIFNCLPAITTVFDNYTGNLNNVVLSSNEKYELLEYSIEGLEETQYDGFKEDRSLLRQALGAYKIVIEYSDVYNKKMPNYERDLVWFNRHQETEDNIIL
ncbi:hypothetical protein SAMN05660461_2315 [Chitinophaga ginsengisegetis]|uniref:Uncharacterized protein n=1 Tax=Chitinophaga ginsengisegetis TaxID=393003 RepID=A0A1T5NNA1_9BACT|nr:hypothetical protein [Chitinophaga ginsengisegetis]SKD01827.1 hypothetical protein SAMN05660461_2315 [Chitinophaga ginsengisegetis]